MVTNPPLSTDRYELSDIYYIRPYLEFTVVTFGNPANDFYEIYYSDDNGLEVDELI